MDLTKLLLFIGLLSAVFGCHVRLLNQIQQWRHLDEQRRRRLLLLATTTATFSRKQQRHARNTYCCGICITRILHHLVADFTVACVRSYVRLALLHHSCGHGILFNKTLVAKLPGLVWTGPEIDTSRLPWRRQTEQASANRSCSKTLFSVNSVCTNNVLNASCVETLVKLRAKFHVVSSLLSVSKIAILML